MGTEQNIVRTILRDLGMGDFNITAVVQIMFMAPAQTDPDMASVRLLTRHLQKAMQQMGASWITADGRIDEGTAHCIEAVAGPQWNAVTWFEISKQLLAYKEAGKKFTKSYGAGTSSVALSGMGLLPSIPQVPGGIFTLAVGGYVLYRYLHKKGHI